MRMILYIVMMVAGLILLLLGAMGVYGSLLPATHRASVSVEVNRPREEVWRLIDEVGEFPAWLPGIDRVEMMPERERRRVFSQTQGRNVFVLEETVKRAPEMVTRTITDNNRLFSGSWEHRLEDLGGGRTRLTVTEEGTVHSPIPRAMMKLFFGHEFYLKKFAAAVSAKCGG